MNWKRLKCTLIAIIYLSLTKHKENLSEAAEGEVDNIKLLEKELEEQEEYVKRVAEKAKELYTNRQKHIINCNDCSVHVCSSEFKKELQCFDNTRKDHCDTEKERVDPTSLGVRLPPGTDPNNLSPELRIFLCTFRTIGEVLGKNLTVEKDIATFLGTNIGYFIKWPLIPDWREEEGEGEIHFHNCRTYECRQRPWYAGAVSGPKDIVIMIDSSPSMAEEWHNTQEGSISLIKILTNVDNVSVMLFSDQPKVLKDDKQLILADNTAKEELIDLLEDEGFDPGSNANFSGAFEKAFDLFSSTEKEENGNTRPKMIVLLSDGDTNELNSEVLQTIKKRQDEIKRNSGEHVIIHSLIINTPKIDTSLPRQISCQNTGISILLENEDEIDLDLTTFLSFNALRSNRSEPIWIEPFDNFSKMGNITSVSIPIFDEDNWLLGVVGKDIRIEDLRAAAGSISYEEVLNELIKRSHEIKNAQEIEPCNIQVLRKERNSTCPVIHSNTNEGTCYNYNDVYYKVNYTKSEWQDANSACISNGGELVSITLNDELSFISSITHMDGSWIGAYYDYENLNNYRWLDEIAGISVINTWWSENEPKTIIEGETKERCVAIDPRGTTHNLYTEICTDKMTFICKYSEMPNDDICDNTYTYAIDKYEDNPPLTACNESQRTYGEILYENDIQQVTSEMALCPIGEKGNWPDFACCPDDVFKLKLLHIFLLCIGIVLIICIILAILDFFEIITFDICCLCVSCWRICFKDFK